MNKFYVEPTSGQLANKFLLQLIPDADTDAKYHQLAVDGLQHNVYQVPEGLYRKILETVSASTENIKVTFWIRTPNGELLKRLVSSKHDPLRHVRLAG